jgi:hypothetical protein
MAMAPISSGANRDDRNIAVGPSATIIPMHCFFWRESKNNADIRAKNTSEPLLHKH